MDLPLWRLPLAPGWERWNQKEETMGLYNRAVAFSELHQYYCQNGEFSITKGEQDPGQSGKTLAIRYKQWREDYVATYWIPHGYYNK